MNITESLADFIADETGLTIGDDLLIGGVSQSAPDRCMWMLSAGGGTVRSNHTGEKTKNYIVNIFFRSLTPKDVFDTMQALEEAINGDACTQLTGYDTIQLEATLYPTDQDLDNEDRTVGLLEVTVTTYI